MTECQVFEPGGRKVVAFESLGEMSYVKMSDALKGLKPIKDMGVGSAAVKKNETMMYFLPDAAE